MDKVLQTLMDVRADIERESVLIAGLLWDLDKNPCAIGATVPRENRNFDFSYVFDVRRNYWDLRTVDLIVVTNNAFEGTPAERRDYMLAWVDEQIANHKRSDLAIPQFETAVVA